jgi:hypothetical protein
MTLPFLYDIVDVFSGFIQSFHKNFVPIYESIKLLIDWDKPLFKLP